jgi:hypothetical protein
VPEADLGRVHRQVEPGLSEGFGDWFGHRVIEPRRCGF